MKINGGYKSSLTHANPLSRQSFSLQVGLRGRTIELKAGNYQASDLKPLLDQKNLLPPLVSKVQARYFSVICRIVGDKNIIHEVEILPTPSGQYKALDDNGLETSSLTLTWLSASEDLLWFLSNDKLSFEQHPELASNITAIRAVIKYGNPHDIRLASQEALSNKELCLEIVARDGKCLKYLDNEMKNDIDIALVAVANRGEALTFVSPRLQDNKEVVMTALKALNHDKTSTISRISDRLLRDREVVLSAVRCSYEALRIIPEPLKSDRRIVLEAVRSSGLALCFAPIEYRNDFMVVKAAVENHPDSITFASEKIRKSFFKPNYGLFV